MHNFLSGFFKVAKLKPSTDVKYHQDRAAQKMKNKGGVLVLHGLGSGKTLTAINATQGMDTDVITPAALRENFKKEIKNFTTGYKPQVMSFEQAARIPVPKKKDALVVDEAHMAGRPESQRSHDLVERSKHYDHRMLLTGTAVRNHPSELAPLINAVRGDDAMPMDPKKFSEEYIAEEHVNPGFFNRVFRGVKPGVKYTIKNPGKFKSLVDGYVDYHAPGKEDFPSASHEVVEVPMSGEQKKYYDFVMDKAGPALRWKIKMGLPPSKAEASKLNSFLSGARQVSNSIEPFGGKGITPKIDNARKALLDYRRTTPNFKALVYSNFLDAGVKGYAKELDKHGVTYGIFDGSLSDKERREMLKDYNSGKIEVLMVSGAGAQGIDTKGTKLVQLLEPHWNNPRLAQATGRAIRYKSHAHLPIDERHVHVQRFMSTLPQTTLQKILGQKQKGQSVDQYLDMLSKDKEQLNNQFTDILKEVGQQESGQEKAAFIRGFEKQALVKELGLSAALLTGAAAHADDVTKNAIRSATKQVRTHKKVLKERLFGASKKVSKSVEHSAHAADNVAEKGVLDHAYDKLKDTDAHLQKSYGLKIRDKVEKSFDGGKGKFTLKDLGQSASVQHGDYGADYSRGKLNLTAKINDNTHIEASPTHKSIAMKWSKAF